MSERKRLGKGLEAILGSSVAQGPQTSVLEIDLDLISPNRFQPRQRFDRERLAELAESIKASGVVQPIVVRRVGSGYEIVVGERRWRAAQMAGLSKIPAIVKEYSNIETLATALIENVQRADLNPLEIATTFEKLIKEAGLSHSQLAKRVGMQRSSVTNYLRLLGLPAKIKSDLLAENLTMGHARALLAVDDPARQQELADMIKAKGLSVRRTEALVRRMAVRKAEAQQERLRETAAMEEELCAVLGTKVSIARTKKGKGRIQIEFYSDDDLARIVSIIKE